MRKNRKRPIKYGRERVILSEILPYEMPVTFSTRHFYSFLREEGIRAVKATNNKDDKIEHLNPKSPASEALVKILFGAKENSSEINLRTLPFTYRIRHKDHDYRTLSVPHPRNYAEVIELYDNYKDLIIYHCKQSPFSIRRPDSVSKFKYHRDRFHYERLSSEDEELIETYDKEYESLKTYFRYKNYSNISRFFESYKYHRSEKKFERALKLDVAKCFDSIYTHSVSWALLNKPIVKTRKFSESDSTFPGRFDSCMRNLNHGETNGIVIGPEFSRIFSELILQRVDQNIRLRLANEGMNHKIHYEVFRYVDDYFIFFNDLERKGLILETFRKELLEYKLHLNESKIELLEKPIITGLTIAKKQIANLIDQRVSYVVKDATGDQPAKHHVAVDSNALIIEIKTIIKTANVEYRDVLNFTLALLKKKTERLLSHYAKHRIHCSDKELLRACIEIVEFSFFIYSSSPRVSQTIRLCGVLRICLEALKQKGFLTWEKKQLLTKKIFDEVCLVLNKNRFEAYTQIETLYLLTILAELGRDYRLDTKTLGEYIGLSFDQHGTPYASCDLNYFTIVVALYYVKDSARYLPIKEAVFNNMMKRFSALNPNTLPGNTEFTLLVLDLIACPYIAGPQKSQLLNLYGIDQALHSEIVSLRKHWFTKWTDFDLGKELDAKASQEVY